MVMLGRAKMGTGPTMQRGQRANRRKRRVIRGEKEKKDFYAERRIACFQEEEDRQVS